GMAWRWGAGRTSEASYFFRWRRTTAAGPRSIGHSCPMRQLYAGHSWPRPLARAREHEVHQLVEHIALRRGAKLAEDGARTGGVVAGEVEGFGQARAGGDPAHDLVDLAVVRIGILDDACDALGV